MIDAGYNYDRLAEKMGWLEIDAKSIRHILITHQDTDHVGAVEANGLGLFKRQNFISEKSKIVILRARFAEGLCTAYIVAAGDDK